MGTVSNLIRRFTGGQGGHRTTSTGPGPSAGGAGGVGGIINRVLSRGRRR